MSPRASAWNTFAARCSTALLVRAPQAARRISRRAARPYAENRRWRVRRVVYATLNVSGSSDNLGDVAPDPAEFAARGAADRAWLWQTFDDAVATKAVAVILIIQAKPGFDLDDPNRAPQRDPVTLASGTQPPSPASGSGYDELLTELRERTGAFGEPVALVRGDSRTRASTSRCSMPPGGASGTSPGSRHRVTTRRPARRTCGRRRRASTDPGWSQIP